MSIQPSFKRRFFWKLILALSLLLVFFTALSLAKHKAGGMDFDAFYATSERIRAGEAIYSATDESPYKYAPIIAYFFYPLSFLSHQMSKTIFALLNGIIIFVLPLSVFAITFGWSFSWIKTKALWASLGVGALASLRLIDNEYHSGQVNGLSLLIMIIGIGVLLRMPHSLPQKIIGFALWTFGALFKIHPLFSFGVLLQMSNFKKWIGLLALTASTLILIPNPKLWLSWLSQIKETTPYFEMTNSPTLQGFYPFFHQYFNTAPWGKAAIICFVLISIPLLLISPKWKLDPGSEPQTNEARGSVFLSIGALLLWALTSSPLPWHHTYMPLWAFLPIAFYMGNKIEKRIYLFFALVIGLSARGVSGKALSQYLEINQIIFLASLPICFCLIWQARRLQIFKTNQERIV